jgi:hypothetical protein
VVIGEIGSGGVDLIVLAQDRDKWKAVLTAIINCGFHKSLGIS